MPSLAAAVDGVSFGIITIQPDGTIQGWNEGARRLFGYTADEVIGTPIDRLERRDAPRSIARGFFDEKVYRHKDGRAVDATIEQTPITNEAGDVVGYMVIARPGVLLLRRPAFVESEMIAEIGSWDLDLRRDFGVWSEGLYRLFGLDPQVFDPNKRGSIEYVHPDDRASVNEAIRRCVQEDVPANLDYRVIRPSDGEIRVFCVRGRLLRDPDGRAARLVGTVQDVTERRRREHESIIAGRLRTVASLGAGVAHSINSPLAAVTNSLDFALREIESLAMPRAGLEEVVEALGEARQASRRIRDVVRDLKIFSRADQHHREKVDLREVLEAAIQLLRHEVQGRARLFASYGAEDLLVYANPAELAVVFANLLANAADAIPLQAPDHEIEVRTAVTADRAIVTIRDTGIGIDPQTADRIFDPFFTTKRMTAPGLGLSICRAAVTALGGTIDFESRLEGGTTFRVALPRIVDAPPPEALPVVHARRRLHVCVIDDDEQLLNGMERALVRDHDVVVVARPVDALARIRTGERFDVIVCDLMMPELGGMELYAEIDHLDRDQARRMIFMSGGTLTEATTRFLDAVANRRLEKPFAIRALLALIDELGARR